MITEILDKPFHWKAEIAKIHLSCAATQLMGNSRLKSKVRKYYYDYIIKEMGDEVIISKQIDLADGLNQITFLDGSYMKDFLDNLAGFRPGKYDNYRSYILWTYSI